MSEWRTVKLGDICEVIGGGTPSTDDEDNFGGNIAWITPRDLIRHGSRYISKGERNITRKGLDTSSARLLPKGTILLSTRAPVGYLAIAANELCTNQGFRNLVPKEGTDGEYVYYMLSANVDYLKSQATGTTFSELSGGVLKSLKFSLPPLPIQRRIAAILSAYDDLIENNTRRIKALEQAAHDLYREWFVEFRFPGHESGELVDSGTEYGMIPQGWGVVPVSDAIEINPRIAVNKDEEKPFIEMARLSESSMYIDTKEIQFRAGNSGSKFQNYDTLFARITPCLENGKTGYVTFLANGDVALGSTEFVVMRSRTLTSEYVYCLSRLPDFRASAEKTMTGASGRQRVQNSFFDNYLIVQPLQVTLDQFQEMVSPMFDEITVLAQKNDVLREARDLLLPRLVSGQVDVSEIEVEMGDKTI